MDTDDPAAIPLHVSVCCSVLGQSADIASWTRDLMDTAENPGILQLGEPETVDGSRRYPVKGVNSPALMEAVAQMMVDLAEALRAAVLAGDFDFDFEAAG